ncbi:MAG: P-II family nitrogen regulator [Planctomycetota bacterium]|nr:P-II family nitrogen regulator [Blastopirellula sp.]
MAQTGAGELSNLLNATPPHPAVAGIEPMKEVIAIVKPFLAEKVVAALADLPRAEMVIREVKGYGRQKNYLERYSDTEFSLVFVAKVEISLIVEDADVEEAIVRINQSSRTGRLGDGKILVLPVLRQVDVNAD